MPRGLLAVVLGWARELKFLSVPRGERKAVVYPKQTLR